MSQTQIILPQADEWIQIFDFADVKAALSLQVSSSLGAYLCKQASLPAAEDRGWFVGHNESLTFGLWSEQDKLYARGTAANASLILMAD